MRKMHIVSGKGWVFLQILFMFAWLSNLMNTDSFLTVYVLCALAGAFCLCENARKQTRFSPWTNCMLFLLSSLFAIATVLANYPLFEPITALLNLFNVGCSLLGGFFIGSNVLRCAVNWLPLPSKEAEAGLAGKNRSFLVYMAFFLLISMIFLFYLFSTGYPVYLAHDSLVSMGQIGAGEYTNHHPYWYTRFIALCLDIGFLFSSDINVACAVYSAVQSLIMAACFSYGLVTLYQTGMPKWCIGVTFLMYAFLPYNLTYSITMWKDTLFGGCSLVVVTALYRILREIGKNQWLNYLVFFLGGIGFCLIRHNGFPIFFVWTAVMLLFLGRKYKKLLLIALIILAFSWVMTNPVLDMLDVADTDLVEVLAVPIQQIARVIANDCTIGEVDMEILNQIFWTDRVRELYSPEIVDPIKFETMRPGGQEYIMDNMGEFIRLWIRLGLQHPGEYVKAWVELTKGFWNGGYYFWIYIRTTWYDTTGIGGFTMDNLGKSLFDALFRYTEKPVIFEPLYSIGLQVWVTIACCFIGFAQKRKEALITIPMVVLAIGLWFMTPVYAEFRYAYPFFVTCPLILFATVFPGKSKETERKQSIAATKVDQ